MNPGNPLQTEEGHSYTASQNQYRNRDLLGWFDVEDLHKGIDKTLGITDEFLLNLTQDTAIAGDMLKPNQNAEPKDDCLKPEGRVDGMRYNNHDEQGIGHKMVNPSQELSLAFLIRFPKENLVNCPLCPLCGKGLHTLTEYERWLPRTHRRPECDGQLPHRTGCSVSSPSSHTLRPDAP